MKIYCWTELSSTDEAFAPVGTWRTLVDDPTVAEKMDLKLDNENADFCFQVGDHQIWAHKQVLEQSLLYFDVMFQSRWNATKKTDYRVQYSYGTFKAFLNYIYTKEFGDGEKERSTIDWPELRELADYYGHLELLDLCQVKLKTLTRKQKYVCGKQRCCCKKRGNSLSPHHPILYIC